MSTPTTPKLETADLVAELRAALEKADNATLAKDTELALWVIRSTAREALAGEKP